MNRDDAQLMQLVQNGNLDAFDELVRRYRAALHRFAFGKLGDAGRAEDLVQETLLAVYASRRTYNAEFSFRTWLWTILLNLCRREISRRSRTPRVHSESHVSRGEFGRAIEPATTETGLTALLAGERVELLTAMLDELSEVQADAIRLRFFGELKYREIAQTMGGSEITAKVRVKKGLLTLANRLRDDSGETP